MPVADPSVEGVDMWLDQDTDGYLMPLAAELTPTFPAANDTTARAGNYGWAGEFVPNFAIPPVGRVQAGYYYGSNGTELIGTLPGGVTPAPAIPVIMVTNDGDGKAATVTIQNATAGTTNRVYCQPIGHYQNPSLVGSITGNGTATIYPGYPATYICFVLSTIGSSLSAVGVSNYFELVGANEVRTELLAGPALAHLEVCKVAGVRIAFRNLKTDPWIGLWALDISSPDTVTVHGGETSVRRAIMEIPRQAGWPPSKINVQAVVRIPESASVSDHSAYYAIEEVPSINSSIGITPVFRINLKRHDLDIRIGG